MNGEYNNNQGITERTFLLFNFTIILFTIMTISKTDNINLIMAFVTVFLDNMNHSLIIPILPFIVEELQASDMESGVLYSGYSLFQLLSLFSPSSWYLGLTIAGAYSDIYGRRIFLLLSLIGSCVGSILQYYSRNIIPLIIWRSITGLFAGSNILVQAYILIDIILIT